MNASRKALRSVQWDLKVAWYLIVRNRIAGSVLVPRVLRTLLYRMIGLDIHSFNIREGQIFENDNVSIGERTFVNRGCSFEGSGKIDIGADCQVAPEAMFITSGHERRADGTVDDVPVYFDIHVGDGAWIGARAVILPGTVIEQNCIIAAGAVVRGRCLAGETYGGVPARPIERSNGSSSGPVERLGVSVSWDAE
jgi:acetyltransferase-like isoleucine patch superfamily enzyme